MSSAAIFLDKDGTLLEDVPYSVDPNAMKLAPGAREALAIFADVGATDLRHQQSGRRRARAVRDRRARRRRRALHELFASCGATLSGVYWCPHDAQGSVAPLRCRLPLPQARAGHAAARRARARARPRALVDGRRHPRRRRGRPPGRLPHGPDRQRQRNDVATRTAARAARRRAGPGRAAATSVNRWRTATRQVQPGEAARSRSKQRGSAVSTPHPSVGRAPSSASFASGSTTWATC